VSAVLILSSDSRLETALNTLVDGERPFTKGQREIERAVAKYRGAVEYLTISAGIKEQNGMRRFGLQTNCGR